MKAALLILPLASCTGPQVPHLSSITIAPVPCTPQASLGRSFDLNNHQLKPDKDDGVCIRAKYGS